jgi:hypothetical protein
MQRRKNFRRKSQRKRERWGSTALFSKALLLRRPGSSAPPGRGPVGAGGPTNKPDAGGKGLLCQHRGRAPGSMAPGGTGGADSGGGVARSASRPSSSGRRRAPAPAPSRRHRRGGGPRAVGGGGVWDRDRGGCGGGLVPGWRPADSAHGTGRGPVRGGVCGGAVGGSEREGTLGLYRSFFEGLVVAATR